MRELELADSMPEVKIAAFKELMAYFQEEEMELTLPTTTIYKMKNRVSRSETGSSSRNPAIRNFC